MRTALDRATRSLRDTASDCTMNGKRCVKQGSKRAFRRTEDFFIEEELLAAAEMRLEDIERQQVEDMHLDQYEDWYERYLDEEADHEEALVRWMPLDYFDYPMDP